MVRAAEEDGQANDGSEIVEHADLDLDQPGSAL
jgi:hypothetical protein